MPYHHGNLREALIDAAADLVAEQGSDAVVLREVSRRVGVSHNAAYRHFADRDELLDAVSGRAMSRFGELMARRIGEAAPGRRGKAAAEARLKASGRAYVEFATTNPGLFRLICRHALGELQPDNGVTHGYTQLSQRLDELVEVKVITPKRRENAEIAAWSAVHGYAMLVLDGPLAHVSEAERVAGLEAVLRVVREGL